VDLGMKKALITGITGQDGSYLTEFLIRKGYQVHGIIRRASSFNTGRIDHIFNNPNLHDKRFFLHYGDLTDFSNLNRLLEKIQPDEIYNLGAQSHVKVSFEVPEYTAEVDAVGNLRFIDAIKEIGIQTKFYQASTSELYGDPSVHPQPENYWGHVNPIGFRSCYDEGKRCAETLFFDYYRQHNLDIKVARIFNTYGPRMHPDDGRVVSNFIVQALKGREITIYGDGKRTRSFCYVDDMIDAIIRFMNTEKGFTGPINLGNPSEYSILELSEIVIELTGSKSKLVFKPLPNDDPRQRQPDITLAKNKLNWEPKTPLMDGLRKTIDYFDDLLRDSL
jgi:UDP-glucuronate decarboxylase